MAFASAAHSLLQAQNVFTIAGILLLGYWAVLPAVPCPGADPFSIPA